MHIRSIFAALLMSISLSATAQFTTIALAYEIALSNLKVPTASTASLMFKECEDCETKIIRMTQETQFIVNGKSIGLRKFRKITFQVRDRKAATVIVKHHLESNLITSLSMTL